MSLTLIVFHLMASGRHKKLSLVGSIPFLDHFRWPRAYTKKLVGPIPFEIIIQLLKAAFHYYVILVCDFNIGDEETTTTTSEEPVKKKAKLGDSGKMMSFL